MALERFGAGREGNYSGNEPKRAEGGFLCAETCKPFSLDGWHGACFLGLRVKLTRQRKRCFVFASVNEID